MGLYCSSPSITCLKQVSTHSQIIPKKRTLLSHLPQLLLRIPLTHLLLHQSRINPIQPPKADFQRQARHNASRGEGKRSSVASGVSRFLVVAVDEAADEAACVAHADEVADGHGAFLGVGGIGDVPRAYAG